MQFVGAEHDEHRMNMNKTQQLLFAWREGDVAWFNLLAQRANEVSYLYSL